MSDFNEFDEVNYPRPDSTDFGDIVDRALHRRDFLKGSVTVGASAFVLSAAPFTALGEPHSVSMGFKAVNATTADTVTLPPGYSFQVVASWGDPLWSKGKEFDPVTRGTGESQELAVGDNNDGMSFFETANGRGVIAVNNEYVNRDIISPGGINTADDVRKVKAGHGVSVFEVAQINSRWKVVKDSRYNRRITADTPMAITGPARGHELMKTNADPTGTTSLGTWNNCGNGRTPWGTYLACEENFNGYFASTALTYRPTPRHKRYGVGTRDWGYNWYRFDPRFDLSKNPNEPHRAGYIVEIDPMDPTSTPKKRTALGRFKHENAEVVVANNGHIVVYLGDDERGEYLYRFVSRKRYRPDNAAANADLLEEGTLWVAKFHETSGHEPSGRGHWIELTHGKNGLDAANGFSSQAEVVVFAREAATLVGATTMDRPEWVAANPKKVEAYCALTNNRDRGKKPNRGGADTPTNGPNPRKANRYGQIVRWTPDNSDHSANTFAWDLYVVAGNPAVHTGPRAGSRNVTPANMFNSPDGISFDSDGRLWIQTDGKYSNRGDFAGMGNNQMLCGDPATGEIRRFLVGPVACEVTGLSWSTDRKTMFVGIQHPGEKNRPSHFPGGGDSVPRSSIIAITRDDGGVIGA